MTLPKVRSFSYLSLAGVVLLVGGLGVAVLGVQQQQDNRSSAYNASSIIRKIICDKNIQDNVLESSLLLCDYEYNCPTTRTLPATYFNWYCKNRNLARVVTINCQNKTVAGSQYTGSNADISSYRAPDYEDAVCHYGDTGVKSCTLRGGNCRSICLSEDVHLSTRDASCQAAGTINNTCCIAEDNLKLKAPRAVTATVVAVSTNPPQITLTWTSSGDKYNWLHPEPGTVTGYFIYRNGQLVVPNETITGTRYEDKNLQPNTLYTYQVKAISFPPNYSSDLSYPVSKRTPVAGAQPAPDDDDPPPGEDDDDPPPPGGTAGVNAPYGVGCGSAGCCARDLGGTCQYTSNNCPGDYATNYCDKGADYKCCKPVAVPAPAADTTAPTTPLNITATTVSTTQIALSWTAATDNVGVTGYKIFQNGTETDSVSANTTTYEDNNLTPNTSYTYYVTAFDAAGNNSQKSNEVTTSTSSELTMLNLNLLIHGIGTGEQPDVSNAGKWVGIDATTLTRDVTVEIYEITGQNTNGYGRKVGERTGQIHYANGGYISVASINMGPNLSVGNNSYTIRIVSGSALNKLPVTIRGGQENTITMTLRNGDADRNGRLNILDYNMINGCIDDRSFGKVRAVSCNVANASNADIDDDGEVTLADRNLIIKELANISL